MFAAVRRHELYQESSRCDRTGWKARRSRLDLKKLAWQVTFWIQHCRLSSWRWSQDTGNRQDDSATRIPLPWNRGLIWNNFSPRANFFSWYVTVARRCTPSSRGRWRSPASTWSRTGKVWPSGMPPSRPWTISVTNLGRTTVWKFIINWYVQTLSLFFNLCCFCLMNLKFNNRSSPFNKCEHQDC